MDLGTVREAVAITPLDVAPDRVADRDFRREGGDDIEDELVVATLFDEPVRHDAVVEQTVVCQLLADAHGQSLRIDARTKPPAPAKARVTFPKHWPDRGSKWPEETALGHAWPICASGECSSAEADRHPSDHGHQVKRPRQDPNAS